MHVSLNKLNSSFCPFCHVRDKDLSFVSNFNRCEAVSAIQIEIKLYVFGSFVLTVASEKIDDQFWRHLGKNLLKGSRT